MTVLSHSPSVIPARRAASFAASRAWTSMPFTLHGIFIAPDPDGMPDPCKSLAAAPFRTPDGSVPRTRHRIGDFWALW